MREKSDERELPEWMVGNIPNYMKPGVMRYLMDGILPGSFLEAVLSNDLVSAFAHADDQNKILLNEYAYMLTIIPRHAWGSRDVVKAWVKGGGVNGGMLDD